MASRFAFVRCGSCAHLTFFDRKGSRPVACADCGARGARFDPLSREKRATGVMDALAEALLAFAIVRWILAGLVFAALVGYVWWVTTP